MVSLSSFSFFPYYPFLLEKIKNYKRAHRLTYIRTGQKGNIYDQFLRNSFLAQGYKLIFYLKGPRNYGIILILSILYCNQFYLGLEYSGHGGEFAIIFLLCYKLCFESCEEQGLS